MRERRIAVLASGRGSNLRAMLGAGLPVAAVATNVAAAPARGLAAAAGIRNEAFPRSAYASRGERDAAMAEWIGPVDLVVCAGYMALLSSPFLAAFPERVVNVHPSLLPAFPGATPIEDTLAAGVAVTGVTVHLVDEGVDTGPILAQEEVAVEPGDTVASLRERLQAVEHRLLPATVASLLARRG